MRYLAVMTLVGEVLAMIEAVAANVAGRSSGVKLTRTECLVYGDFASGSYRKWISGGDGKNRAECSTDVE